MRILFITSTRVGDAVLSSGLLDHLIAENPGARVTIACGPAAASLFDSVPNLERLIVLDKMAFSLHWPLLLTRCAGRVWDILVDLRNYPMFYVLAARKRWRIGPELGPMHRIERLARVIGLAGKPPSPRLWISEQSQEKAKQLIPDDSPVLAVGPTANWPAKTWRAENFTALIERLCGADGILAGARVAVFGRDDERPMVVRLLDSIPRERCLDLVGRLDLAEAHACLKRCSFYVGNDSGLMHLAAAADIPTLGLFGPSPPEYYAPWGTKCAVVTTAIPYLDLFPPNFDHRATGTLMDSLTVDAAEIAARDLWQRVTEAMP